MWLSPAGSGSQQFSCYRGYSDSFEWLGPYDDHLGRYDTTDGESCLTCLQSELCQSHIYLLLTRSVSSQSL